jgi:hypothetical protein
MEVHTCVRISLRLALSAIIKMQHDRPDFPTMEQVEKANHEQLARWYRFLPSGDTKEQQKIMDRIAARFKRLGAMTPALEKKIGV